MSSIREKILGANDLGSELIEIPEWDVTVEVKALPRSKVMQVIKACTDEKGEMDTDKFVPALVIAAAHDPLNHQPIFEAADLEALNAKSPKPLLALHNKCSEVCGLTNTEKLEKNSERTESVSTPSV